MYICVLDLCVTLQAIILSCLLGISTWMSVLIDKSSLPCRSELLFSFPSAPDPKKNCFTYSLSHLTFFVTLAIQLFKP